MLPIELIVSACALPSKYDRYPDYRRDPASGSEEQLGVIRFAYHLDAERKLTGNELSGLVTRMTETDDPEAATIRDAIVRGFYGQQKK